jgi:hypothetical protein
MFIHFVITSLDSVNNPPLCSNQEQNQLILITSHTPKRDIYRPKSVSYLYLLVSSSKPRKLS